MLIVNKGRVKIIFKIKIILSYRLKIIMIKMRRKRKKIIIVVEKIIKDKL